MIIYLQSSESVIAAHPDECQTSQTLNPLQPIDIANAFQRRIVTHILPTDETEAE